MRTNVLLPVPPVTTHEGAPAIRISAELTLQRLVMASLLFEDQYYQSGSDHAAGVAETVRVLVGEGNASHVAAVAVDARVRMYLRHMPLYLLALLTQYEGCGSLVAAALPKVILRADEPGEFIAIYSKLFPQALRRKVNYKTGEATCWALQGIKLPAAVKRGLRAAMLQFTPYSLAKYDRANAAVRLRDVLRYVHPRPADAVQAAAWKQLIAGELASPDTWEVALSGGGDKKETFERLLREDKLGGLAFLRNLRNMQEAKVDTDLIRARFRGEFKRVLPFRFVAALRYAPQFLRDMDIAMAAAVADVPRLPGTTGILVDVSGSMDNRLSGKSDMTRMDVAAGLAVLVSAVAERARVYTFSSDVVEVPPVAGLGLVRAVLDSQQHGSTYLGRAMDVLNGQQDLDRVIVVSDEQAHDVVPNPRARGYMVNVAGYTHGVAYGRWTHIDGWSERVLDFVREFERTD